MTSPAKMILSFVAMLVLALGVTGAVSRYGATEPSHMPQLGDLATASLVEIHGLTGAVLNGEFKRVPQPDGGFDLIARLSGTTVDAYGEVEIEIPAASDPDQRQELEVEIRGVLPEAPFTVHVDGREVISIVTDTKGMADVEVKAAAR